MKPARMMDCFRAPFRRACPLLICMLGVAAYLPAASTVSTRIYINGVVNSGTGEVTLGSGGAGMEDGDLSGEATLLVNKEYQLVFTGQFLYTTIDLTVPAGYAILINGAESRRIQIPSSDPDNETTDVFDLVVREAAVIDQPGDNSGLSLGGIHWGVSLGRAYNGAHIGSLVIPTASLDNLERGRSVLSFHGLAGQAGIYRDIHGIRQITTPEVFVDITDLPGQGGGFIIKFYPLSARAPNGYNPIPIAAGSLPYLSYTVSPGGSGGIAVTRDAGDSSRTTVLSEESPGQWGKTIEGELARETMVETEDAATGTREEIHTMTDGDLINPKVVRKTKHIYRKYAWNGTADYPLKDELLSVVQDSGGANLTTQYEYYTNASSRGSYSRLKWIKYPDGGWVKYDYYETGAKKGLIEKEYRPWKDGPSGPDQAGASNCQVIEYDYANDWNNVPRLAARKETKINGGTLIRQTAAHAFGAANGLPIWVQTTTALVPGDGNKSYVTKVGTYRPEQEGANAKYNDLPYVEEPGDGTKKSYVQQYGAYSPGAAAGAFSPAASGVYLRTIVLHGSAENGAGEGVSMHEGQTVDTIYLVPNRSTKTVSIQKNGRVLREEIFVYTGSGNFSVVGTTDYIYTDSGRLTGKRSSNGGFYQAEWASEFKIRELSDTGIEYLYSPDAQQRVKSVIKTAPPVSEAGDFPAQNNVATFYTYNAAGNITGKNVMGGSLELSERMEYDLAGRLISATDANGLETRYAYDTGQRKTTVTFPGGGTQVIENYLDGRTKKVTGSAQIAQAFDYTFTSGRLVTTLTLGPAASGAWRKLEMDGTGRVLSVSEPNPAGAATTISHVYNGKGQLIKTELPGMAPTLYSYDSLGAVSLMGLKIGEGSGLVPASGDVITGVNRGFINQNNAWWWQEETFTYPHAGSGAAVVLSKTMTRLSGFDTNAGIRAEQRTTDIHGNTSVTTVEVDPLNRIVSLIATSPGSTIPAEDTWLNGLLVKSRDIHGEVVRQEHDGLGRPVQTIFQRKKATGVEYHAGKNLVAREFFVDGNTTIATYGYDAAGRVNHVIDALGRATRAEYNHRGQLTARWGDAAQPVTYDYDGLGRLQKQSTYRSLAANAKPTDTDGGDATTFTYKGGLALLAERADAAGKTTKYEYDSLGRLASVTNARGQVVGYSYDGATGLLTGRSATVAGTVAYAYNRLGALSAVSDSTGTRTFSYDDAMLALTAEALPAFFGASGGSGGSGESGRVLGYAYAEAGALKGRLISYGLGRAGDGQSEQSNALAYTATGLLESVTARGVRLGGGGFARQRTFAYGYHPQQPGLVVRTTEEASGHTVEREYDTRWDVVSRIKTLLGATTMSRFDYEHDDRGLRVSARQSGAAYADYGGEEGATFWRYDYNARGELTGAGQYLGGNAADLGKPLPGRSYLFDYDAQGNRLKAGNTGSEELDEGYEVNALNQITRKDNHNVHVSGLGSEGMVVKSTAPTASEAAVQGRFWSVEVMTGNANGAAKETVPLYFGKAGAGPGGTDLLAKAERTVFQPGAFEAMRYDADGNLVQDGVWNYSYDELNQLVEMETRADNGVLDLLLGTAGGARPRRVAFQYDYMGRRVAKRVYALESTGDPLPWTLVKEARFLWQDMTLIAEADGGGNITRRYYWGLDLSGGMDGAGGAGGLLMIRDEEEGADYLPSYDGNGNVAALVEAGGGRLAAVYEYSPFGELLRKEGAYAAKNPFIWSTKYADAETGLIYYGFRYYSPRLGRFINRDPLGEAGGINLYGFVGNSPANGVDALGLITYNLNYSAVQPGGGNWFYQNSAWYTGWYSLTPVGSLTGTAPTIAATNNSLYVDGVAVAVFVPTDVGNIAQVGTQVAENLWRYKREHLWLYYSVDLKYGPYFKLMKIERDDSYTPPQPPPDPPKPPPPPPPVTPDPAPEALGATGPASGFYARRGADGVWAIGHAGLEAYLRGNGPGFHTEPGSLARLREMADPMTHIRNLGAAMGFVEDKAMELNRITGFMDPLMAEGVVRAAPFALPAATALIKSETALLRTSQAAEKTSSIFTHIPSSGRKLNQLTSRGWGRQGIHDVVNNPHTTRPAVNRATGNPATAYIRQDGHYVVRDNVTGDLVQMSDTRVPIGTGPGQWVPDPSIQNPFIP